jgi:membrane protein
MIWLWLSTVVVLAGAELDAEMEQQTGRDTTIGLAQAVGGPGCHNGEQGRPGTELERYIGLMPTGRKRRN